MNGHKMNGHKISDESIQLSYKHAYQVEKNGKRLEQMGASLSRDKFTQQESEFVQKVAQQIQECAKTMLEYTRIAELNEKRSTEAFTKAAQQHGEAIRLHTEINKILLKSSPKKI